MLICDYSFAVFPSLQCNIGQFTYFWQPFCFQPTIFPKNSADKICAAQCFFFLWFFYFTVPHILHPKGSKCCCKTCFQEINLQNFLDSDTSSASSTVLSKLLSPQMNFIVLGTLLPYATQLLLWYVVFTGKIFWTSLVIFLKNTDLQTAVKECYSLFILSWAVSKPLLASQQSPEVLVNWTV